MLMETATIIAIAAVCTAGITGAGIGITIIVLLIRGSFMMGKIVNQVDGLENKVDALTDMVNDLRSEVQQTNQILVGLANHTHDADGRTVFTIPTAPGR